MHAGERNARVSHARLADAGRRSFRARAREAETGDEPERRRKAHLQRHSRHAAARGTKWGGAVRRPSRTPLVT
eukprot:1789610-Pyramimonas_sp.AAC.1